MISPYLQIGALFYNDLCLDVCTTDRTIKTLKLRCSLSLRNDCELEHWKDRVHEKMIFERCIVYSR